MAMLNNMVVVYENTGQVLTYSANSGKFTSLNSAVILVAFVAEVARKMYIILRNCPPLNQLENSGLGRRCPQRGFVFHGGSYVF